MKVNQISNFTLYDRYPEIFNEVSQIITNPKRILSFGCSTGIECNTLHEKYFKDIKIIGLDINEQIIEQNIYKNIYNNIEYTCDSKNIIEKCDLIFAMSVLCRWPEEDGEYTFETFTETLNIIDGLLEKNGYICIYNSKYLFTETELFTKKYEIVKTIHSNTGFVSKYNNNNDKITVEYPYFLFKKIAF
jgi:predicted TPR repeat methyltransferase